MTDEQIKAIRERLEAATPGPWICDTRDDADPDGIPRVYGSDGDELALCRGSIALDVPTVGWEDASFIAHAPEDIAALLAEVERLREVEHDYALVRSGTVEFREPKP